MKSKNNINFSYPDQTDTRIFLEWWEDLVNSSADRAWLRRSRSPGELAMCPAYHSLLARYRQAELNVNKWNGPKLAVMAGLAAHVKGRVEDTPLAKQMALPPKKGDNPRVSELRFRRILSKTTLDDLYLPMYRVLRMLDGVCDLWDLARSIYWWEKNTLNQQGKQDTRTRWAVEYYSHLKTK
ncbi:type I-E CRISPR-associated protein Cse2/CasB [Dethiosulfatarculus sandiegensis]|uniref:CRISPR-associated protein Cse2 n=1 Tax=Dethiosulfatarculus sandiegensis TaxID=1429043 RepID=A0A0D2J552_9BACT|nr:type I-E CRISPR-associated protein Cse2/CasB [Dethiosulfatarculus sandiegensis]KIX10836.1 hypothetical protein X474_26575 [Dethiosulfatarculus sandiegensis]